MSEVLAAYNNSFDVESYQNSPSDDPEKRRRLDSYTRRQLETHIGERFNALLSVTNYELKDGIICGQNMDEPFMDSIIRGRNFRRIHGDPIDFDRETAEVIGFAKIEKFMAEAEEGEMIMSISKPGGSYPHNFTDVYIKKRDYVEARRYSTALTTEEYVGFARSQGLITPDDASDSFFLENPFQIRTFENADDVHQAIHKEHKFITEEEFAEILRECAPLIIAYINALASGDLELQKITFNAVLNRADDVHSDWTEGREVREIGDTSVLGQREVREVLTGCGSSSGFSMTKDGKSAPFSVSEFALPYPFDTFGTCRTCHSEAMLGPCKICEPCDLKTRKKQRGLLN